MTDLKFFIILILFCFTWSTSVMGQSEVEFGKNRVQYSSDLKDWSQYKTDHFTAYFYNKAKNTGLAAIQMAEMDYLEIQELIEHQLSSRIELIVYTDLSDLHQSNLGVEEAFTSAAGQTKIIGNKMFVHFNGNHKDLHRQVREGVAGVFLNSLFFGTSLQDMVKNTVSSEIPDWFTEGLSSFVGEDWNNELDEFMRDHLAKRRFRYFRDFVYENPRVAGHSFWNFIYDRYGASAISNLLYLTKINRKPESAFLYILGEPQKVIEAQWLEYYQARYKNDRNNSVVETVVDSTIAIKNRKQAQVTQMVMNPGGDMIAYVENEIGRVKIYIHDLQSGSRTVVYKYGFRNVFQATDYDFPLVAWNPDGLRLTYVYEKRDEIYIADYDLATGETIEEILDPRYDRIHSISYKNTTEMVLSATVSGRSDLYMYNTRTKLSKRLTDDHYDDLDAVYSRFGWQEGILFSSNRKDDLLIKRRIDTILPIDHLDIFFLEMNDDKPTLTQVTRTPLVSEQQSMALDSIHYTYLSDDSGVTNRHRGHLEQIIKAYETTLFLTNGEKLVGDRDTMLRIAADLEVDSVSTTAITYNLARNESISSGRSSILLHHAVPRHKRLIELKGRQSIYRYHLIHTDSISRRVPLNTAYRQENIQQLQLAHRSNQAVAQDIEDLIGDTRYEIADTLDLFYIVVKTDTVYPIDRGLRFQSIFPDPPSEKIAVKIVRDTIFIPRDNKTITTDELPLSFEHPPINRLKTSRTVPYKVKMKTDFVTTKMDNSLLFEGLESYTGPDDDFTTTTTGLLIKANLKDILEDYELEFGLRIPVNLSGTEYFVTASDYKKRLDKEVAFYRKSVKRVSDDAVSNREQYQILIGQFGVRYPLDVYRSVRGRFTLRNDKTRLLATDEIALNTHNDNEQRVGLRAEYVFDNTLEHSPNILNGTRYKFYSEIQKGFDIETQGGLSFDGKQGIMTVIGVDARHYQRLARHSVLALRAAGATSFGTNKILYYLGGTDNWLIPKFSSDVAQPATGNEFGYQTLAANLRGFDRNARNGNSYALINAELRIPIFRYLSRNMRSSFFKNFQVVGFADVGTAWQGGSPFSTDNPVNINTITAPPIFSIDVKSFREPVIGGYGVGLRALLLGYFVRADYAWGVENNVIQEPKLYISLGYDF